MFATRFISPSVGFSLAISYFYCYAVSVASELSAAAVLVSFWTDASPAITITVGLVLTVGLNFLGVRWYGESEVLFSMIKIGLFVLLIIVSIVITLGGAPEGGRIGFQYWKRPGPFEEFPGVGGGDLARFLAFFSAFINAAYTFIGIEVRTGLHLRAIADPSLDRESPSPLERHPSLRFRFLAPSAESFGASSSSTSLEFSSSA